MVRRNIVIEETPLISQTRLIAIFIGALFVLSLVLGSFTTIKAGQRGILTEFGKVVRVLDEGFHWKIPIAQSVTKMSVKTNSYYTEMTGATKDMQDLYIKISVNYRVSPENAYKTFSQVGTEREYTDTVIGPAISQIVKANTVKYDAEEVLDNRDNLRVQIESDLKERFAYYGIEAEFVNIEDMDFTEEYRDAIESKAVALQNQIKEERELEIRKIKANQKIEDARGESESNLLILQAEAEGMVLMAEARAKELELQKEHTTKELVELKWIEKWNGVLPAYNFGSGSGSSGTFMPIFQLPMSTQGE